MDRPKPVLQKLVTLAFFAGVIVLWDLATRIGGVNRTLFPGPLDVWVAFAEMAASGDLWSDLKATTFRAIVGYTSGVLAGISLGFLTARFAWVDWSIGRFMHVVRSFPPVALVPFVITWLGLSEFSKYFLVSWGVFFPVWVSTHLGVGGVPRSYMWTARSLGATKRALVGEVLFPAALPQVLSGMRVAIGICFICVFVAEMAGAYEGLGYRISTSYLVFRVDRMTACLLLLGVLGSGSDIAFVRISHVAFPWIGLGRNA